MTNPSVLRPLPAFIPIPIRKLGKAAATATTAHKSPHQDSESFNGNYELTVSIVKDLTAAWQHHPHHQVEGNQPRYFLTEIGI
jgi:hypothetical protein